MTISSISGTWEIGVNWPYPKLYFLDYYIMSVAVKGSNLAVYDMTNSGNVWTATERIDLGAKAGIVSVDIAGFDIYTVIVVNKGATKEIYERNVTTGAITLTAVTVMPGGNSICNYRGQVIIGGLYSTGAPWSSVSECSVAWSDIGSHIMIPGDATSLDKDIVAGYRKMEWDENGNNTVWKVLTLDKAFMVYGDKGLAVMKMTLINNNPAMSYKKLKGYGAISTYAVNGDNKIHGFVNTNYDWCIVTEEGVKVLGYRKEMEKLTSEIVVSYEKENSRFYISDGLLCYVFNEKGMYSTNQCVSSIGMYKSTLFGFFLDNADDKIRIGTTSFDANNQGNKTIESVETGATYETTTDEMISGYLETKYTYNGSWIATAETYLNPRGIFTFKITGREFKIILESQYESGAWFKLSNLRAKIKFSDKRNIRGRINVS